MKFTTFFNARLRNHVPFIDSEKRKHSFCRTWTTVAYVLILMVANNVSSYIRKIPYHFIDSRAPKFIVIIYISFLYHSNEYMNNEFDRIASIMRLFMSSSNNILFLRKIKNFSRVKGMFSKKMRLPVHVRINRKHSNELFSYHFINRLIYITKSHSHNRLRRMHVMLVYLQINMF